MKNSIVCLQWHYRNEINSLSPLRVPHSRLDECDRYCNLNTIVHLATPLETCLLQLGFLNRALEMSSKRTKPSKVWEQEIITVSLNQSSPKFPSAQPCCPRLRILLQQSRNPEAYLCRRRRAHFVHFSFLNLCLLHRRTIISSYWINCPLHHAFSRASW